MRVINEIIVHCSATPEGKEYTVSDIDRWHKEQGYKEIGYHYVIYIDGSAHAGRDISKIGAHCKGHNTNTIGVCYIGGCASDGKTAKDTRTAAQKEALINLLKELVSKYSITKISGHRDYAAKDCPSFDAKNEYKSLLK